MTSCVTAGFLKLTALHEVSRHLLPCPRVVHSSGPACPVSPPSRHLPGEGIAFRIQILGCVLMRSAFVRARTDHPWRRFLLHNRTSSMRMFPVLHQNWSSVGMIPVLHQNWSSVRMIPLLHQTWSSVEMIPVLHQNWSSVRMIPLLHQNFVRGNVTRVT
jgi:hypothetical protein